MVPHRAIIFESTYLEYLKECVQNLGPVVGLKFGKVMAASAPPYCRGQPRLFDGHLRRFLISVVAPLIPTVISTSALATSISAPNACKQDATQRAERNCLTSDQHRREENLLKIPATDRFVA